MPDTSLIPMPPLLLPVGIVLLVFGMLVLDVVVVRMAGRRRQ